MITLYAFGPAFGLPDPSPFVVKTMVQLKMAGQPYEVNARGFARAPKGKLPFIVDDGQPVADSTFIRWHLEQKYAVDLDLGLSPEQRAMAWAIEKLIEDHCYWIGVHWRWIDDANFRKVAAVFFKPVPQPFRMLVEAFMRRRFRGYLQAHGMGRHNEAEMLQLAQHALSALATVLGDKPYLMGYQPCGADAMCFAMMASVLCPHFDSPVKQAAQGYPNLLAYAERMHQRYFSDQAHAGSPSRQVGHRRSA